MLDHPGTKLRIENWVLEALFALEVVDDQDICFVQLTGSITMHNTVCAKVHVIVAETGQYGTRIKVRIVVVLAW